MPRRKRREGSGLIHHACLHGVDDEFVFIDDEDRIGYVTMLAATVLRYGWLCLGYCLMGTHLHLLVETPEPNFGEGMRWLHGHYGRCFNLQHGRTGHLFKGRYHDEPVVTDGHLINVVGYIAVNPVEACLCNEPQEWEWGSHRAASAGAPRSWMAHGHLVDRLAAITGSRTAYEAVVASRLKGSDP
jgi:REP element-mobilizing transposase RayT